MAKKEEPEELQAIRKDWLDHPFTQARIPSLRHDFEINLKTFFSAASMSTDHQVAHAYRRFAESLTLLKLFSSGKAGDVSVSDLIVEKLK